MTQRPADKLVDRPFLTITERHYAIDLEGDDLEATRIWCAYVYHFLTDTWWEFTDPELLCAFINERPDAIWVGHNVLSWDIPTLIRLYGLKIRDAQIVDTLLLGQLYFPKIPRPPGLSGNKGPHSLEAWGLRFGIPKGDFHDFSQLTPEMLTYCKQDVVIAAKLYRTLVRRMRQQGFSELSCWVEHEFRRVINRQQDRGFWFDQPAALELFNRLRKEEQELGERIRSVFKPKRIISGTYKYRTTKAGAPHATYIRHQLEFGDDLEHNDDGTYTTYVWQPFNIGSPAQRLERMLELGYEPVKFTKTGNPSIDEDSLVAFAKTSGIEEVGLMADWLVANGRANMIGTWLNHYNPTTGAIHGDVWTCGAATRRCTHSNPNSANIPGNGAKYGHECRALWGIRHEDRGERLLVGVDAAALEMRMFAHYLDNEAARKRYIESPDPHAENAADFGVTRSVAKTVFYATLYGASGGKINTSAGRAKGDRWGPKVKRTFVEGTPGLKRLLGRLSTAFKKGFIETIDGGFVRPESEHAALNYLLQSAGAIVMKLACILLERRIVDSGWDAYFVGNIHDEWQLDCAAWCAEAVKEMGIHAIRDAGVMLGFSVPLDGDGKIGDTWAETH